MKKIAFLLTFVFATAAHGQMPGPAPTFMHVRSTVPEKGHAILLNLLPVPRQVAVVEKINVNGQFIERTRIVTAYTFESIQSTYELSGARVITPDGKQLPIDEVWKRLKENVVVAVAGDSNTPNEAYLRALHNDTLVIIPAPTRAADKKKEKAP